MNDQEKEIRRNMAIEIIEELEGLKIMLKTAIQEQEGTTMGNLLNRHRMVSVDTLNDAIQIVKRVSGEPTTTPGKTIQVPKWTGRKKIMTRKRFIKLIMAKEGFERKHAEGRAKHFLSTRRFCEFLYAHRDVCPMQPRQPHLLTYQRYWDEYENPKRQVEK